MITPTSQPKTSPGLFSLPGKIFDWIVDTCANFATIIMAFIVVLITVEIILRYFFLTGVLWANEVTEDCMLWMTLLATTWVLKKEGHVIVDLIPSRLKPRHRAMLYTVLSIIGIAVCFAYTWYGAEVTLDYYQRGRPLSTLLMPKAYILYMILPIGFLLLMIQFCRRTAKYLTEFINSGKKTI